MKMKRKIKMKTKMKIKSKMKGLNTESQSDESTLL